MLAKVSPFWITWERGVPPDAGDERRPPVVVPPGGFNESAPFAEPGELPLPSLTPGPRSLATSPGGKAGLSPARPARPGRAFDLPSAGVTLWMGPGLLAFRSFSQSSGDPPAAAGAGAPVVEPWPGVAEVVPPSGSKGAFVLGKSPGATGVPSGEVPWAPSPGVGSPVSASSPWRAVSAPPLATLVLSL